MKVSKFLKRMVDESKIDEVYMNLGDLVFFECSFSPQPWEHHMKGILQRSFTVKWDDLLRFLMDLTMEKKKRFCFRYTFQAALYSLWRERNQRRHGEPGLP